MLDYFFGLVLFGLGLGSHPSVLGEQQTAQEATSSQQPGQLRVMHPKFSAAEQEAFQKERAKREANIKRISPLSRFLSQLSS